MSNIENIFIDRSKRERETRLKYSKYIFNSHLIMFLIIVAGAVIINYSSWLTRASNFELHTVFIVVSILFSYLLVTSKVKTYIEEADSVFLLPLEQYYSKIASKTVLITYIQQLILLVIFYFITKPITDKIGSFNKLGLVILIILIAFNNLFKLAEVVYFQEKVLTKGLLFITIFSQVVGIFLKLNYSLYLGIMLFILLIFIAVQEYNKLKKEAGKEAEFYYLLKWNEAAEYDKHRKERYLKFVNMFVDVPLKGIRVSRRKYFDILLPRLKRNSFNQENSFSYYYYRVFLRQENTIYLVLRLMLIAGIIISNFNNTYVSVATIISYNYLAIIQLVPLYKQITNNMWHNILPVSEKVKVTSFKKLLTIVMLVSSVILTLVSIFFGELNLFNFIANISAFIFSSILSKVFISKVK